MKLTKELVRDFIQNNFLEIHQVENKVMTVGIKWGYGKQADDHYGRKTVLGILDLLEKDPEYQKLLN